jgi:hypothetical protein
MLYSWAQLSFQSGDGLLQAHDRLGTLYLRIGDTDQAKVNCNRFFFLVFLFAKVTSCFAVRICCGEDDPEGDERSRIRMRCR